MKWFTNALWILIMLLQALKNNSFIEMIPSVDGFEDQSHSSLKPFLLTPKGQYIWEINLDEKSNLMRQIQLINTYVIIDVFLVGFNNINGFPAFVSNYFKNTTDPYKFSLNRAKQIVPFIDYVPAIHVRSASNFTSDRIEKSFSDYSIVSNSTIIYHKIDNIIEKDAQVHSLGYAIYLLNISEGKSMYQKDCSYHSVNGSNIRYIWSNAADLNRKQMDVEEISHKALAVANQVDHIIKNLILPPVQQFPIKYYSMVKIRIIYLHEDRLSLQLSELDDFKNHILKELDSYKIPAQKISFQIEKKFINSCTICKQAIEKSIVVKCDDKSKLNRCDPNSTISTKIFHQWIKKNHDVRSNEEFILPIYILQLQQQKKLVFNGKEDNDIISFNEEMILVLDRQNPFSLSVILKSKLVHHIVEILYGVSFDVGNSLDDNLICPTDNRFTFQDTACRNVIFSILYASAQNISLAWSHVAKSNKTLSQLLSSYEYEAFHYHWKKFLISYQIIWDSVNINNFHRAFNQIDLLTQHEHVLLYNLQRMNFLHQNVFLPRFPSQIEMYSTCLFLLVFLLVFQRIKNNQNHYFLMWIGSRGCRKTYQIN